MTLLSIITLVILLVVFIFAVANVDRIGEGYFGFTSFLIVIGAVVYAFARYKEWLVFSFPALPTYIIIAFIAAYLIAGVFWMFFKWRQLVLYKRADYKEQLAYNAKKDALNKATEPQPNNDKLIKRTGYSTETVYVVNEDNYKPQPSKYKEALAVWVLYWPLSMLRYVFSDIIIGFATFVTNVFEGTLNRITDSLFKNI